MQQQEIGEKIIERDSESNLAKDILEPCAEWRPGPRKGQNILFNILVIALIILGIAGIILLYLLYTDGTLQGLIGA